MVGEYRPRCTSDESFLGYINHIMQRRGLNISPKVAVSEQADMDRKFCMLADYDSVSYLMEVDFGDPIL